MSTEDYQAEVRQLRAELAALRQGAKQTGERHLAAVADERPLRQRDILRALLERLKHQATGDRSTVRLTRNAKGDTQVEVFVSAASDAPDAVDDAAAKCRSVYDALCVLYPLGASPEVTRTERGTKGAKDGG